MDPVTLIVTALAAGAASALQDDAKGAMKAVKKIAAKKARGRPAKAAPVSAPRSRKSGPLSPDDLLRVAVLVVGLPRATSFIEEESRKIRSLLGG